MEEYRTPWDGVGTVGEVVSCINRAPEDSTRTPESIAARFAAWMAIDDLRRLDDTDFEELDLWFTTLQKHGAEFDKDRALVIAKLMVSAHRRSDP